jgi:hyperosmotically inducible protein
MRRLTSCAAVAVLAGWLAVVPAASAAVSDAWITTKTKLALMTSKDVSATAINVDTVDGVVTLHGKVTSTDEKARAESEAKKIDGVREVRNLLQVVPAQQQKVVKASDDEIDNRVKKALKDDASLKDSSIAVQSVHDGVVLLGGKANTIGDHLRAVEIARGVPGVRKVETEITSPDRFADDELRRRHDESATAGTKRGVSDTAKDMWITSDVKMRLLADSDTPATDINVDTRNGVVTLFGMVPNAAAKSAAEADAKKVSAVKRVMNELQIVPKAKQDMVSKRDDELKDQIEDRLEKRDLQGAKIDVDVKNGVARLTGTVADDMQRLSAATTARATPGVRAVRDELRTATD